MIKIWISKIFYIQTNIYRTMEEFNDGSKEVQFAITKVKNRPSNSFITELNLIHLDKVIVKVAINRLITSTICWPKPWLDTWFF